MDQLAISINLGNCLLGTNPLHGTMMVQCTDMDMLDQALMF